MRSGRPTSSRRRGTPGRPSTPMARRTSSDSRAEADVDLVYTATPWRWHVPVCVAAMENGKHSATEVPAAYTLEDCWRLVETAERTNRHCLMMENVNYGRAELLCLNLVRQGLLGEILHAECGYLHDLRGIKFADDGEGLWRRDHAWTRDGNLYPTHGLGPVANCMDINRGDKFDYLVSMSSPSRGLQEWAARTLPRGAPQARRDLRPGRRERQPHQDGARRNHLRVPRHEPAASLQPHQSGAGDARDFPGLSGPGVHRGPQPGASVGGSRRRTTRSSNTRSGPRFRKRRSARATAAWTSWRTIGSSSACAKGFRPTSNVYDAAALSAVCELSEICVANGSAPVEFPDFTRGKWKEWVPWPVVGA